MWEATQLNAETRDPPSQDPRDHKEQPSRHNLHPDTLKQTPTTPGRNVEVIVPFPTGLTPAKWKQTATLCPLDWPSNYSLLRLCIWLLCDGLVALPSAGGVVGLCCPYFMLSHGSKGLWPFPLHHDACVVRVLSITTGSFVRCVVGCVYLRGR